MKDEVQETAAGSILWRREKMHNASTAAGCAEIRKSHKTGHLFISARPAIYRIRSFFISSTISDRF